MANDQASDLIELAANEAIKLLDDHDNGDLLIEWVFVAHVSNPDKEISSGYPMLFSNGDLPDHRAKGLLIEGLDKLRMSDLISILNAFGEEN